MIFKNPLSEGKEICLTQGHTVRSTRASNWIWGPWFHITWSFLSTMLPQFNTDGKTVALVTEQWNEGEFAQFSSVAQSCPTLCDPMNHSTPGLPVHHQLPEFTQTHVHRVTDTIQPSHPLLPPSPLALNLSQHQGLFKWVSFSHQVAKILEFQLQHQSFQWTPRTDFL